MRRFMIVGIVVIAFGAFILLRGASFTSRRNVLEVGDVKITADEQRTIPAWVGGAAVVAGAALILAGMRQRA